MALDRSRVLETAQKHLAKGQYDKAIAEYQKLVSEDPNDVRTWLKIGDLYTRKGSRREACDTYSRVARTYAAQGFFLKAVAVYKQILKLDPSRLDVQVALAEMYEHLQLVSDALNTYEQVAVAYARSGDIERALDTLGKMADLDPDNIPVRIKYAEALSKAGKTEAAAEAFEQGARLLEAQGRIDDYIKVAERLLYHRPADVGVAKELSRLYLERHDAKRALGKLQLCFKANPRDVETLELLAQAFQVLGQVPKTVSVYREIARLHQEANRGDERAIILRKILSLDPGDAEARQALAAYAPSQGSEAAARGPSQSSAARRGLETVPPSAVIDSRANIPAPRRDDEQDLEMLEADDAELIEEEELIEEPDQLIPVEEEDEDQILIVEEEPVAASRSASSLASVRPGGGLSEVPPEVAREAQIARLLTECDVFKRYGLKSKVIDQLNRVLELDPTHVEAREKLKDAYLDDLRTDEAIAQLYALVDLMDQRNPNLSAIYLQQIVDIDPESEPARSRFEDESDDPQLITEEAADEDEVLFVDDEEEEERTVDEAILHGRTVQDGAAFPEDELAPPPSRDADRPPAGPTPGTGALRPMSPEEFEAAPLRPSTPGEMEAARVRASMPPGEVEEVLDEAEFFLAQGLYEEARSTLSESLSAHPDHPLILDKLHEVAELAASAAAAQPAPAAGSADDSFLLAEKLAEELGAPEEGAEAGSDVLDVETVFAQFKKGVEEQIGLEDTDTHFDLGIAYKEMGLLDDAVHEFDLARKNPQRECIAYTMMGLCYVEKGDVANAIAHFKKGLYADTKTDREELGLYFELGTAYELLHDPKEALYYYQKVQKRDPDFRSVGAKIKALASPQAAAQEEGPKVEMDDVDRAFDDLMGED